MKLKKNIPLIDQHDKNGFWGGKFGGSVIPETLKKPVEDLTIQFNKLSQARSYTFTSSKKLISSYAALDIIKKWPLNVLWP